MQTYHTKPIMGKRAAPEDIATQPMAKVQKLAQSTTGTECLFLDKLAQELRDHIYDYVAMSETKIGAHVTFKGTLTWKCTPTLAKAWATRAAKSDRSTRSDSSAASKISLLSSGTPRSPQLRRASPSETQGRAK